MLSSLNQMIHIFSNTTGLIAILSVVILYRQKRSINLKYYGLFLLSFVLMFTLDYFYTVFGINYETSNYTFNDSILELISETITNSLLVTTTLFFITLVPIKNKKSKKSIRRTFLILFVFNTILLFLSICFPITLRTVYNFFNNLSFIFILGFNLILLFMKYPKIESFFVKKFFKFAFVLSLLFIPLILVFDILQFKIQVFSFLNNLDFDLIFFSIWNVFSIFFFLKYFNSYMKNSFVISPSEDYLKNIGLTAREKEVFNELFAGRSYNDIADVLNISPVTVKTHVLKIYKKAGVKNKLALLQKVKETYT